MLYFAIILFIIQVVSINIHPIIKPKSLTISTINEVIFNPFNIKVISFISKECQSCYKMEKFLSSYLQSVSYNRNDIQLYQLNCDEQIKLCQQMRITTKPFIIVFDRNGLTVEQYQGGILSFEQTIESLKECIFIIDQLTQNSKLRDNIKQSKNQEQINYQIVQTMKMQDFDSQQYQITKITQADKITTRQGNLNKEQLYQENDSIKEYKNMLRRNSQSSQPQKKIRQQLQNSHNIYKHYQINKVNNQKEQKKIRNIRKQQDYIQEWSQQIQQINLQKNRNNLQRQENIPKSPFDSQRFASFSEISKYSKIIHLSKTTKRGNIRHNISQNTEYQTSLNVNLKSKFTVLLFIVLTTISAIYMKNVFLNGSISEIVDGNSKIIYRKVNKQHYQSDKIALDKSSKYII